jgi:GT2 family glycosyltransferase
VRLIVFMFDSLIICTKDRPKALSTALESVSQQSQKPHEILVIDSSLDNNSEEFIEKFKEKSRLKVDYFRTEPGLTKQRNFGIEHISSLAEIVHFIDDDVILSHDYFRNVVLKFQEHKNAIAIGGAIQNLPEHRIGFLRRLFLLDSKREGVVLKSGINILNFVGKTDREVDWVSGCSMSFRRIVFSSLKFDETRLGNGVGEDVDMCLRAKFYGKVIWSPFIQLIHDPSPINRWSADRTRVATFYHHKKLADDGLAGVKYIAIYYSEIAQSFFKVFRAGIRGNFSVLFNEIRFWREVI